MICIHHNDLDGRCSAAIVARWNEQRVFVEPIKFIEMDYKDILYLTDFEAGDKVFIVDFSLKPDVMAALRAYLGAGGTIHWIDHHATAKDYPYQDLQGLRDFEEKRRSGCELTWEYLFGDEYTPRAVNLIGDYDKWALLDPRSKQFYEGMKIQENGPLSSIWDALFRDEPGVIEDILMQGYAAIKYRDNYCAGLCKSFGYETEISGHKAYACNMFMFGSGGFGERFGQYPLCIAYIHDGKRFTVSLYSETVDVGQVAKAHGGGGHKGAAGFVCDALPFEKSW